MNLRSGRIIHMIQVPCRLLELPSKLRIEIYKYVLFSHMRNLDFRFPETLEHPVLHMSPFIRNEALPKSEKALEFVMMRHADMMFASNQAVIDATKHFDICLAASPANWDASVTTSAATTLDSLKKLIDTVMESGHVTELWSDWRVRVTDQIEKWEL